jgi:predicted N-acetyltransferase YhbS
MKEGAKYTLRIREEKKEDFESILNFVERVFKQTDYTDGILERALVAEIRDSKYYVPELSMVAEDDTGELVGHFMLSKFPIEGRFEEKILLLAPVAVAVECQRQGIGKVMLMHGIVRAKELGYVGIIVEGNPKFYSHFGFKKSSPYNIIAGEGIPAESLMAMELYKGGLLGVEGEVSYSMYDSLS